MNITPMTFEELKKERDAKQAQQLAVIKELKAQVQMYQELIGKGQPAKYRETIAELVEALEEARQTIRAWHGPMEWNIYDTQSPEMKRLNGAIAKVKGK